MPLIKQPTFAKKRLATDRGKYSYIIVSAGILVAPKKGGVYLNKILGNTASKYLSSLFIAQFEWRFHTSPSS